MAQKKREIKIGQAKDMNASEVYINWTENQSGTYENALAFVRQIKRIAPSIAAEIVSKMYGALA